MIEDNAIKGTLALIRDIIIREMDMPTTDRVMIYNQKFNIPNTDDMFITIQFLGATPYSNRTTYYEDTENGLAEVQDLNMQELIQIKVMSRSDEALFRKHEVIMALESTYSQQIQESNSFKIASIPGDFLDVSDVEASARLNTYVLTVALLTWYKKTKSVDYYDSFSGQVKPENHEPIDFTPNTPFQE